MNIQPAPDSLFDPKVRHMMSIAHQDDEIMYCGLVQRMGPDVRFLWTTNGDGIAPFVNADPKEYAELRKAETDAVLTSLGRSLDSRRCFDYSEIEIYDNFVKFTTNPEEKRELLDYFLKIGRDIYEEIKAYKPNVVWTSAFQNGHPEHDLVHILTAYAIRQVEAEENINIDLYQFPEYEYTILIPMRFHPLYKGVVHCINLTDEELALKKHALECYPSQVELFEKFQRVMSGLFLLARLVGKKLNLDMFLAQEYFALVDKQEDYTRSTHFFEWANYMRDYNKGVKIRFDTQIATIARGLLGAQF